MKKYIIISALFLAACGGVLKLAVPVEADAERAKAKFPGITLEDLTKGKAAYEAHCGACHGLKDPAKYSEAEWRKVVPGMVKKANNKNNANIDATTEEQILKYVVTIGSTTK